MKRLMILMVAVALVVVPEIALADPWTSWAFGGYGGYRGYGYDRDTVLVGTIGGIGAQVYRDTLRHQETQRVLDIAAQEQQHRHQSQPKIVYTVPQQPQFPNELEKLREENQKLKQEIEKLKLEIRKLELQLELKRGNHRQVD